MTQSVVAPSENFIKGKDYIGVGVVYFCHDGNGNFLMARRSAAARDEHGRWDIGGGAVEFGETLDAALRREIREEYCADVLEVESLGYRDVHREQDGRQTHWIGFDFAALIDPSQVRLGEPHKFSELNWFRMDALPPQQEWHSQMAHILDIHREQLAKIL